MKRLKWKLRESNPVGNNSRGNNGNGSDLKEKYKEKYIEKSIVERKDNITREKYKDALAHINLSDEKGMELLNQVSGRANRYRKLWKQKLAVIVLCVIALGVLGTGVSYANTGKDPMTLLAGIFANSDSKAVQNVVGGIVEADEILQYNNLQIVLEQYFYNMDQGVAFAQFEIRTTDGTPLVKKENIYQYLKEMEQKKGRIYTENWKNEYLKSEEELEKTEENNLNSETVMEETAMEKTGTDQGKSEEKSAEEAELEKIELNENGYTFWISEQFDFQWPNQWEYSPQWQMVDDHTVRVYQIVHRSYQKEKEPISEDLSLEVKYWDYETNRNIVMGEVPIKETGQLEARTLNCSSISNCKSGTLNGACLVLNFKMDKEDRMRDSYPIQSLEIKMKDGTQYVFYAQEDDEMSGAETIWEETQEEEEEHIYTIPLVGYLNEKNNQTFEAIFSDFLDMDEIESVMIDGIDCFK